MVCGDTTMRLVAVLFGLVICLSAGCDLRDAVTINVDRSELTALIEQAVEDALDKLEEAVD